MKKINYLLLTLAILISTSAASFAQSTDSVTDTASGLEISPAIMEFSGKPGITVTKEVKVTNPLDKEVTLYPMSRDFYTDDQDGTPLFYNDDEQTTASTYQLSKWISFIEESITLKAKETRQVEFTVTIPKNGEPGGHYAGVMFSTSKPTATTGSNTQVGAVGLITSLVFLTVDGAVTEQLQIKQFDATKFSYSKPIEFDVVVKNSGNVHVTPKGTVKVTNWQKKEVATVTINPKSGKALPQAERKFSDKWTWGWKNIGYYNLTASLTYGQNDTLIDSTVRVLVLPIWFIIAVSVLLLLIIILIIRKLRGGKGESNIPLNDPTPPVSPTQTPPTPTPIATQPPAPQVPTPVVTPNPAPTVTPSVTPVAPVTPVVEPVQTVPVTDQPVQQVVAPTPTAPVEPSVSLEMNAPVVEPTAPKVKKPTAKEVASPTDTSAPSA